MSKVKIKVPVDYEYSAEFKKSVFQYDTIDIDENSLDKYKRFSRTLERIFSEDEPHAIARKIRKLVEEAYYNDEIVDFFNSNQWLLRFAYSSDVVSITSEDNFHTITEVVDFPEGCYIDSEVRKVFTKKINVPIWRKKKALKTKNFIEWLILDDKNTLAEKIEASMLSDYKGTRNLLLSNLWLLMKVENRRRAIIMRELNIPFFAVDTIKGIETSEDGSLKYINELSAVPEELALDYEQRNKDLRTLIESPEGTFDNRVLNYYYSHIDSKTMEDSNELLRDNLWLLDYVSSSTREKVLNGLDLSETRKKVKFRTIEKRRVEGDLHSCTIYVDAAYLDYYDKLNRQLLDLVFRKNAPLDELAIAEFIKSDETVLKLWPWLSEYVTDPTYIVGILEAFTTKEKKR